MNSRYINIITLGCSKNTVDSENVAGHLSAAGYKVFFDRKQNDCPIVLVNTCGFIGDAKEESVNVILEQADIKRRGRSARTLIVFGCLVERYLKDLQSEIPEVDAWFGVHDWQALIRCVLRSRKHFVLESDRLCSTPRHYAYLKISEGCNRSCSYCAIPLIRGRHVSRPIDDLVNEAKRLVANGVKELILIAQDTTYYGLDLYGKRCLGLLLDRLATESGASWIRLHYTYPTSFPEDAIDTIRRHPNICNYIDIPLQHINTDILRSMQRGINREATLALIRTFREKLPNVCIRTTLIVGYPGETEKEFDELKQFVTDAQFDRMGVFAYSPEEGTPAMSLGDPVSDDEKQRRVDELMAVQEDISLRKNEQRVGQTYMVLIDRREGDFYVGRTEFDSPEVDDEVLIPVCQGELSIGTFCQALVTEALENDLMAVLAPGQNAECDE